MLNTSSMYDGKFVGDPNYFESSSPATSSPTKQPSKREALFFVVSFSLLTLMSLATAIH